jgi:hypothetical protein
MIGVINWLNQIYQGVLNSDFWWILVPLPLVLLFSINPLINRFVWAFEYYFERIAPAKCTYAFEFVSIFFVIILSLVEFLKITNFAYYWQSITIASVLGVAGTGVIYQRMLKETGCPSCRNLMPFRRRAIARTTLRHEKREAGPFQHYSGGSVSLRKPHLRGERSWDEIIIRRYRIDRTTYVCINCKYEWDENESILIKKYSQEVERAPEAYRPKDSSF